MLSFACAALLGAAPLIDPSPASYPTIDTGLLAGVQESDATERARVARKGIKGAVDGGLRHLRSLQNADGHWGDTEANALALQAYLASPRKYKVTDGPFLTTPLQALLAGQRSDGGFGSADEEPLAVVARTAQVLEALRWIKEEPALSAADGAARFLGLDGNPGQPAAPQRLSAGPDLLAAAATTEHLFTSRADHGGWEGPEGSLRATARAVLRLSELDRVLPGSEQSVADAKPLPAFDPADAGRVQLGLERARTFLLDQQTEPGRWGAMGRSDLGITAMVAGSLALAQDRSPELQAALQQTVRHLLAAQDADGAIHEGQLQSYVTSASVMALTRMDPAAHDAVVQAARAYLQRLQADEGEGYTPEHRYYGGVGYGGDERPDLSNLQMALEALSAAGVEEGDESYRKALEFLQRTQNRSESNDLDLEIEGQRIRPGNDGGAAYAPGESKAGFVELPDGTKVPRSYGSMTYALLRGFLFAGLAKDDPRVVAAWEWIKANYTLDVNPGFPAGSDPAAPYQGLFYYYYTMAKALALFGEEQWTGANGEVVRWREQLAGRLLAMQRADGSWVNENSPRWWEGNPTLATAYAVLALEATLNDSPRE